LDVTLLATLLSFSQVVVFVFAESVSSIGFIVVEGIVLCVKNNSPEIPDTELLGCKGC
jgi:hypothetical protein